MRNAPLASIAVALLFVSPSIAAPSESARVLDGDRKIASVALGADVAAARAFVDVRLERRFATGKDVRAAGERVSLAVPSLELDRASRSIVLVDSGRRVVCATFDDDGTKETGACTIAATIEPRTVETEGRSIVRDALVVRVSPR